MTLSVRRAQAPSKVRLYVQSEIQASERLPNMGPWTGDNSWGGGPDGEAMRSPSGQHLSTNMANPQRLPVMGCLRALTHAMWPEAVHESPFMGLFGRFRPHER